MTTGAAQKVPLVASLNPFAEAKALAAIRQLGRSLPCSVVAVSGQIVTVKIEVNDPIFNTMPQLTIPIATSVYDWLPVQIGDRGVARASEVYLGGISGLGGGVADLTTRGNLTAVVFEPIAHATWTVPNPNQRVVQGLAGVHLKEVGSGQTLDVGALGTTFTRVAEPHGPTAGRPATPPPIKGQEYFDDTLGIPIWFNGSVWINAAGTPV